MTDDRSIPRPPDGGTSAGGDLVRQCFQGIVDREGPALDAWAIICRRVESGETASLTASRSPLSPRRTGSRVLAAAAVVIVLVGGIVAVRLASSHDQGVPVTTDSPSEPVGWYLPIGLPAGWHPLTVELSRSPLPCPCREATWTDVSGNRRITFRSRALLAGDQMLKEAPGLPVDLGPGAQAILVRESSPGSRASSLLLWEADGQAADLRAPGLTADQLLAVGRALVADPLARKLPVDGFEPQADRRGQALLDGQSSVIVTYRAPSGHRVEYRLRLSDSPLGGDIGYEPTRLNGQPMPVLAGETYTFLGHHYTDYVGRWPGATTRANGAVGKLRDGSPNVTPEEAVTLFSALRPATTAEWRAMVSKAEDPADGGQPNPRLGTARTLTALLTG